MDWINEEGGFNAEATDMPEGVRSLVDSKGYKGVEDICTAYTNAASKLGVDPSRLMTLPDKPDDAEGWGNLYKKLGRPDSVDGYKPEVTMPKGIEAMDDNLVKSFSAKAHEIGLTNSQLSKIMQFQLDSSASYLESSAAEQQKAQEVAEADKANAQAKVWDNLKIKHSVKTDDDMKALVEGAKETAEKLDLYDLIEEYGHGDDPRWIAKLTALNGKLSDSLTPGGGGGPARSQEQKMKELQANPAFNNAMDPDHAKVMREFTALFGIST